MIYVDIRSMHLQDVSSANMSTFHTYHRNANTPSGEKKWFLQKRRGSLSNLSWPRATRKELSKFKRRSGQRSRAEGQVNFVNSQRAAKLAEYNIHGADFQGFHSALLTEMQAHDKKKSTYRPPASIKGHERKDGVLATMQRRMKACFNNVVEAFVFIDFGGNDRISKAEFGVGMERLGLAAELDPSDISKAVVMVAGGNRPIEMFEFLRTFAWSDVFQV